jgi:transcriptional regulator of acetoin/glycerol metabolism
MMNQPKADSTDIEIAKTGASGISSERIWLASTFPRSLEPLLTGLGIELLAREDRELATVRVESVGSFDVETRTADQEARLRVERVRFSGRASDQPTEGVPYADIDRSVDSEAIEFEGPGSVWAAASCIVSLAFGLSPPILTADEAMFTVVRAAVRAGQVDSPILVTGETGTGKELLVRLIHAASGRAGGMSSVNCAALNDPVLGTRKVDRENNKDAPARGTAGAENRLDELCAAADTTLFLDQVSELSAGSQARVLRAIMRAGSSPTEDFPSVPQASDVSQSAGPGERDQKLPDPIQPGASVQNVRPRARLVSATNRPLRPMVSKGRFKRELYDRLAVLTLGVPPLRERRGDIGLLAAGFLRAVVPRLSFTPEALQALGNYPFPGNVRELRNLVTRFAILQRDEASQLIQASDVRPELAGPPITPSIWKTSPFRMRREMALQALTVCGGDRTAAARKLGISVRALQQHVVSVAASTAPRGR